MRSGLRLFLLASIFLVSPLEAADGYLWATRTERLSLQSGPPVPTGFNVETSDLATNGIDVLAVWDDVTRFPGSSIGPEANVWAAIIRPDDSVVPETRIHLGSGFTPQAIWTGSHWLVVWQTRGAVYARTLSAKGELLEESPIVLTSRSLSQFGGLSSLDVAWADGRAAIIWRTYEGGTQNTWIRGLSIDGTGNIILAEREVLSIAWPYGIVETGEGYLLLAGSPMGGSPGSLFTIRLDESLTPVGPAQQISSSVLSASLVKSNSAVVAIWHERNSSSSLESIMAVRLTPEGGLAGPPHTLVTNVQAGSRFNLEPIEDGFVLLLTSPSGSPDADIRAWRLDANAFPIDSSPRVLGREGAREQGPSLVTVADRSLLLFYGLEEAPPESQRLTSSLDPIGDPFPVSFDFVSSEGRALAPHADGFLAVWGEEHPEGWKAYSAVIGFSGNPLHTPTFIGAGLPLELIERDHGFLLLLGSTDRGGDLSLVELDAAGASLHQPVIVGSANLNDVNAASLAAGDGRALIVWADGSTGEGGLAADETLQVRVMELGDAGPSPQSHTVTIEAGEPQLRHIESIATETGWYVAWRGSFREIHGVALSRDGQPIDSPRKLVPQGFLPADFELTSDGMTVLLVWLSQGEPGTSALNDYLAVVSIASNGSIIHGGEGTPSIITEGWNRKMLAGVWQHGDGFHVGWFEREGTLGPLESWDFVMIRINSAGRLLDLPPHKPLFQISELSGTEAVELSRNRIGILGLESGRGVSSTFFQMAAPIRSRPVRIQR